MTHLYIPLLLCLLWFILQYGSKNSQVLHRTGNEKITENLDRSSFPTRNIIQCLSLCLPGCPHLDRSGFWIGRGEKLSRSNMEFPCKSLLGKVSIRFFQINLALNQHIQRRLHGKYICNRIQHFISFELRFNTVNQII